MFKQGTVVKYLLKGNKVYGVVSLSNENTSVVATPLSNGEVVQIAKDEIPNAALKMAHNDALSEQVRNQLLQQLTGTFPEAAAKKEDKKAAA